MLLNNLKLYPQGSSPEFGGGSGIGRPSVGEDDGEKSPDKASVSSTLCITMSADEGVLPVIVLVSGPDPFCNINPALQSELAGLADANHHA